MDEGGYLVTKEEWVEVSVDAGVIPPIKDSPS